jgi:alkanesulfonate monooxygenase SsuD/methylene tetrahydromethanopterin reductase-like flavin-dependent oxidoreductase (luciferase family)
VRTDRTHSSVTATPRRPPGRQERARSGRRHAHGGRRPRSGDEDVAFVVEAERLGADSVWLAEAWGEHRADMQTTVDGIRSLAEGRRTSDG